MEKQLIDKNKGKDYEMNVPKNRRLMFEEDQDKYK